MQFFYKNWLIICVMFMLSLSACVSSQNVQKEKEDARIRAQAHTNLGAAYYQQGKLDIALEEFKMASEFDPTYALAFNGLGLVHAALKQDKEANEYYKKAIDLEPNSSESHNNYGNFLCSRGRYDESIQEYLAAVKNPLYTTPAAALTNAGVCSLKKKDVTGAESFFNKALEIDPLLQPAAYQLALLQFQRNDAAGAYKTLQNALLTQPYPEVLLLTIQLAKSLKLQEVERDARMRLFQQYPNSEQAKNCKQNNC
jgi:type IV pilus assembly protein PilF